MEKTIQIFIASTAFTCSEEAYAKLSSYLDKLKEHFRNETDNEEIIRDIESRIAEKLLELGHPFITIGDVSTIIAEIGNVSEIDDTEEANENERPQRRLYRDTDNAFIAGVAGGIAAYFDIPALFVRLLFLVSLLFGGTGFFLYIILWILIPEAKTATQRLQMRGKAVTFQSISDTVRARITESEQSGLFRQLAQFVHSFVTKVLQFSAKVLGVFITGGSFIAIIGLTVFMGIILTNWNAPYNDIPFREASSTLLLITALVSGFIAAVIPLLFIFMLGYRLLRKRVVFPAVLGFAMIGVWSIALVAAGISGVKIAGDFYTYLQTSPQYEVVTQTQTIDSIESIVATDTFVRVQNGDSYSISIEGRVQDNERLSYAVKDGVLTIHTENENKCLFCLHSPATVIVTAPNMTSVEITRGSLTFDSYTDEHLEVIVQNASTRGSLAVDDLIVKSENSSLRIDLSAQLFTLTANGSALTLSGSVETAALTLQNTSLYADTLVIEDATLSASNSHSELDIRGTFKQSLDEESSIELEQYNTSAR